MNLLRTTAVALLTAQLLLSGCAGSRKGAIAVGPIPNDTNTAMAAPVGTLDLPAAVPDDSASIYIRMLESDPLMNDAPLLRGRLFSWVAGSPRLRGFETATAPIDELQSTTYPYREELFLQYIFAGAAWYMTARDTSLTIVDQQLAGAKSLLTAYKNLLVTDSTSRSRLLDDLDDARRHGVLRRVIERRNPSGGKP